MGNHRQQLTNRNIFDKFISWTIKFLKANCKTSKSDAKCLTGLTRSQRVLYILSMSMIKSPHPQTSNILSRSFDSRVFTTFFRVAQAAPQQHISLCDYSTIRSSWNWIWWKNVSLVSDWESFACVQRAAKPYEMKQKKTCFAALETGSGKKNIIIFRSRSVSPFSELSACARIHATSVQ